MKGVLFSKFYNRKKYPNNNSPFFDFFASPLLSGLIGFVIFFLVLLVEGYLNILMERKVQINFNMDDIALISLGFVFGFFIKILKNYSRKYD